MSVPLQMGLIFLFGMVGAFIISLVALVINETTLMIYLKKNKYERWRELTTYKNLGPGVSNIFKFIKYLKESTDNEDIKILKKKDSIKILLIYVFSSIGAIIVSVIMITIIAKIM